jgi:predicted dithiol-disulfide oxidoreductase (DUF899 family)
MTDRFDLPEAVSSHLWLAALDSFGAKEAALRDHIDAVNHERRELPMVEFDMGGFEGPDGTQTLVGLFGGRRQLIVYHFWFEPGGEPCAGCSQWTNNLGDLRNFHDHETTLVFVSRAPIEEIVAAQQQRGWSVPWYSVNGNRFNEDTGYAGVAQISVFVRNERSVFLTYVVREGSELRRLTNHWTLLERTPAGS